MSVLAVNVDLKYDPDLIREIQEFNGDPFDIAGYVSETVNDIIRADIDNIHSENAEKAVDLIVRYHLESSLGYLLPKPPRNETPAPTGRGILLEAIREVILGPDGTALIRNIVMDAGVGCRP